MEGLVYSLATFFVYRLLVIVARKIDTHRREAFRNTWRDIKVERYKYPSKYHAGVGLQIISNKPQHYDDFPNMDVGVGEITPEMISVTQVTQNETSKNFVPIKLPLKGKSKGGIGVFSGISNRSYRQQEKTNEYVSGIVVANWDEDQAWIENIDGQKAFNIEEGCYYLSKIEIKSKIIPPGGGKDMEPCEVTCELLYNKNKDGKKEVSISVIDRFPKYEY